ncbi:helix-turn-helix domain-containing protein [Sulfitobacter sp. SK012]|uniref:helix-turn-helix domain-containing protein n=1 Tax=Sulfitobacter sp. SK012 TaxID=1389005 RepID=UPI0034A0CD98
MIEDSVYTNIGARIRAIRLAFGGTSQKDWCDMHNFSTSQYNNWESGLRRISIDEAMKLCDIYGIDLDYIYRGKRDGLSANAAKLL